MSEEVKTFEGSGNAIPNGNQRMKEGTFRYLLGTPVGAEFPERERDGQTIRYRPLAESLYDRENVGPMFDATFPDGRRFQLFADEVVEEFDIEDEETPEHKAMRMDTLRTLADQEQR